MQFCSLAYIEAKMPAAAYDTVPPDPFLIPEQGVSMASPIQSREINEDKMNQFLGKVVTDFGASLSSSLAYIGQKLGLYKALAANGPLTPAELAEKTNTTERYVREWLVNQAAGGYVEYDPESGRYTLTPEQAAALTDEQSPFFVGGGFFVIKAMSQAVERIESHFLNGGGMLWGEHHPDLFIGTERFFRPGYTAHLVSSWIPALDGVEEKLKAGAKVADVGCGHGASTIILAKAYPNSEFWGFDNHEASIAYAKRAAEEAGVADRVHFAVGSAQKIPDQQFDLIAFFDCLHDMGDPVGACKRAAEVLKADGTALIVEPMAGNNVQDNFNPIGRTFAGASTLCCTANSMALDGPALGAVATEDRLKEVVLSGGFKEFRRATETPFNRVFEARK